MTTSKQDILDKAERAEEGGPSSWEEVVAQARRAHEALVAALPPGSPIKVDGRVHTGTVVKIRGTTVLYHSDGSEPGCVHEASADRVRLLSRSVRPFRQGSVVRCSAWEGPCVIVDHDDDGTLAVRPLETSSDDVWHVKPEGVTLEPIPFKLGDKVILLKTGAAGEVEMVHEDRGVVSVFFEKTAASMDVAASSLGLKDGGPLWLRAIPHA